MKRFLLIFTIISFGCEPKEDRLSNIQHGYIDKVSYRTGDSVSVMLHPVVAQNEYKIKLFDINENLIDEVDVDLFMQNRSDSMSFWRNGYGYKETFNMG
jgi:hypothetical protein